MFSNRHSIILLMQQYTLIYDFCFLQDCRVTKSPSYGRLPSIHGRSSPRSGGMSRRSKSPSSPGSSTVPIYLIKIQSTFCCSVSDLCLVFLCQQLMALQAVSYPHLILESLQAPVRPVQLALEDDR